MAREKLSQQEFQTLQARGYTPDEIRAAYDVEQPPMDLGQKIKSGIQSGLAASDKFLGRARQGSQALLQTEKMTPGGQLLANILNPVPADTAQAAAMLATLPIKGSLVTGPLMRAGAAGLTGGLIKGLQGENPVTAGLGYAGAQGAAELPGLIGGGILAQRKLSAARQNLANQGEFASALNTLAQQGHKADVASAGDTRRQAGASLLADYYKQNVPALRNMPSNEAGLVDMFYGRGKQLVQNEYDKAMQAVMDKAKGVDVTMRPDDLAALGFGNPGQLSMQMAERGILPKVSASELIQAMQGKSDSARLAYRRAVAALDAAGIGDPQARQMYKTFMSGQDFFNNTKALQGGVLNPGAVSKGLTGTQKNVNVLRSRGVGNAVEGPFAESLKVGPLNPEPPQTFTAPAELPEGFKTRTVPDVIAKHPWAAAGIGAGVPLALMGTPQARYGIPFDAALLGALALGGKEIATQAPMSPLQQLMLRGVPFDLGAGIRASANPPQETQP